LGAVNSLLLSRIALSVFLMAFLQKKIQLVKLAEYTTVAKYWLIAVTVFLLLWKISFVMSSSLALLVYFLLICQDFYFPKTKME